MHAGSVERFSESAEMVFVSNQSKDYHEEMDGDHILQWAEKLVPSLTEPTTLVIDNAAYQSILTGDSRYGIHSI